MTDTIPETAHLTADVALFATGPDGDMHILLVKRRWDPYKDCWALPGGLIEHGEDTLAAALRELAEETGITVGDPELILAGVFADPGRDPRGRYVTFAYTALLPDALGMFPHPAAADDAADARWVPLADLADHPLAFDHSGIIRSALDQTI